MPGGSSLRDSRFPASFATTAKAAATLVLASWLGLLVTNAAGASAPRKEVSARASVSASLTYRAGKTTYGLPSVTDVRLTVVRHGETLIDNRRLSGACPTCMLPRKVTLPRSRSLVVGDLSGDPEPEVLFVFYTGGAHCCVVTYVYSYRARSGTYKRSVRNWAEGYEKKRLDRDAVPEFVTGDNRFGYAFTAHAFSGEPIQIWNYTPSGFVNVTRRFPRAIEQDANRWLNAYRQERSRPYSDVRGFLAPTWRRSTCSASSARGGASCEVLWLAENWADREAAGRSVART